MVFLVFFLVSPPPPSCHPCSWRCLIAHILETLMLQDSEISHISPTFKSLACLGTALPLGTPPTSLDLDLRPLTALLCPPYSAGSAVPEQVQQVATLLALWGWSPQTLSEGKIMLGCQCCFRSVGCWNFSPIFPTPTEATTGAAQSLAAVDSALATLSAQLSGPTEAAPAFLSPSLVFAAQNVTRSLQGLLQVATTSGRAGTTGSASPMALDSAYEGATEGVPSIQGEDPGSVAAATTAPAVPPGLKLFNVQAEHRWFCPFQKPELVVRCLSGLVASSLPSTPVTASSSGDLLSRHVSHGAVVFLRS